MSFLFNSGAASPRTKRFGQVHSVEIQGLFGKSLNRYVKSVVPNKRRFTRGDTQDGSGLYEEQYSCLPPRLLMITISILEIACFLWDVVDDNTVLADGPAAKILMYNPFKRYEAWRFVTYMFVHVGEKLPVLQHYHNYLQAGQPKRLKHITNLNINYTCPEMKNDTHQYMRRCDTCTCMKTARRIIHSPMTANIGYAAHIAGALAGLLVGINILRNLEIKAWERKVWWASMVLFSGLLLTAIFWNVFAVDYFPVSRQ
uniref:Integrase zinc-binding domain-containing protein n=1 Tax=Timema bartmani TaxID=61472 RepID=A0A7R9EY10_9NEOP|nr:unnamed protein product [Timema bartmani]